MLPDLAHHVVAPVVAVELRDRRAADESAERGADLADRHAESGRPVAIHGDAGPRRLVGDRVLNDDELAGLHRPLANLLGRLHRPGTESPIVRSTYWIGRPSPAPGRDGGAKAKACTPAFSFRRFWISCLVCGALLLALAPFLQLEAEEAAAAAVDADDQEAVVDLGDLLARIGELLGEGLRVIGGRVFRRVEDAEIGALILFRRKLGGRLGEQEHRGAEENGDDDERHAAVIQRTLEAPAIPVLEPREGAVDEGGEPALSRHEASAASTTSSARASRRRCRR